MSGAVTLKVKEGHFKDKEVVFDSPARCLVGRAKACRLQVASAGHPRWNRNLGTDEAQATATIMCAADQTIYHDAAHPSVVVLPVQPGA